MTAPDPQSSNIGKIHIAKRAPSRHDNTFQRLRAFISTVSDYLINAAA